MHTIYIRDLIVSGIHGCYQFEKENTQSFKAGIEVELLDWPREDDLADTLNYEMLRQIAVDILSSSPKNLLETLATDIAEKVFNISLVEKVVVTLEKLTIFPDCVPGVKITKKR